MELIIFFQIVKCLVLRRMKQLEQSLIGGAVTDSVLNGKLVDLQRENRDLRKNAKKLQEKLDLIVQSLKTVLMFFEVIFDVVLVCFKSYLFRCPQRASLQRYFASLLI